MVILKITSSGHLLKPLKTQSILFPSCCHFIGQGFWYIIGLLFVLFFFFFTLEKKAKRSPDKNLE